MRFENHSNIRSTRRDFLRGAAAGTALASLSSRNMVKADDTPAKDKQWIDAHVHVWTPDLKRYPLADGFTKSDMRPPSFTPEELLAHATPVSVSRIVLIQMSYYGYDNSYMLDMMRNHPAVFSGVAVIDENDRPSSTMLDMKRQGVRGFRIEPGSLPPERWLAGQGMQAMWKCGADERLAMCHLINPKFLPSVDAMCRRYPKTPVVIDHFARIGIDGKIRERDLDNLCRLAKHENVTVKVSAYYALGQKRAPYLDLVPMIRRLLDEFGHERLMWASDGPFQVVDGHNYRDSIDLVRSRVDSLSDNERQWLLQRTAERVFF